MTKERNMNLVLTSFQILVSGVNTSFALEYENVQHKKVLSNLIMSEKPHIF